MWADSAGTNSRAGAPVITALILGGIAGEVRFAALPARPEMTAYRHAQVANKAKTEGVVELRCVALRVFFHFLS